MTIDELKPIADAVFDAREFLRHAPEVPGIYCMLGKNRQVLYVGKAKNIRKRLASYFGARQASARIKSLVGKITAIDVTVTQNETEALLLEQTLIKKLKPAYNVLLRDDKSYPYIHLSEHSFPQLSLRRGKRRKSGECFGPYPGAGAARESLRLLQKVFKVRQCKDSYFANRSRPCLQYQIKRCKAPCTGYVSAEEYAEDVRDSVHFLQGKSKIIIKKLEDKMDQASASLDFEKAAVYRDQIKDLQLIQTRQMVDIKGGDADVIGMVSSEGISCVAVLFIRNGSLLGSRHFFYGFQLDESDKDKLVTFLSQFYISHADRRDFPGEIILPIRIEDTCHLESIIRDLSGKNVHIKVRVRSERKHWLNMAIQNAGQGLTAKLADKKTLLQRFKSLQEGLSLSEIPARIECFDVSHLQGEKTVASCVVFDHSGSVSTDFRQFNIKGITPGDDYAALQQALEKRYGRICRENEKTGESNSPDLILPDLILIDGGKGQLGAAIKIIKLLQLPSLVYGIAKGEGRKAEFDVIIDGATGHQCHFERNNPGLLLLQQIRDAAHGFAVTGHRQRRAKSRKTSSLEQIAGIGPKRRSALIKFFGGLEGVRRADIKDIMGVEGISQSLAEEIYQTLHGETQGGDKGG